MSLPIETVDEVERGHQIFSVIDSFWLELHSNKAMFRAYGRGLGNFLAQRYIDFLHIYNTLDRKRMPVGRPLLWKRLTFTESELLESKANILRYGDGAVYGINTGDVSMYIYGGFDGRNSHALDADADWLASSVLTNTPINASVSLVHGTDFWFDREQSSIVFRSNPFDNDKMPIVNIRDSSSAVTDREITLWAFNSFEDMHDIDNQLGALLGVHAKSSGQYRDMLNAAIDSFVDGPTQLHMMELLCNYVGIECVKNAEETVEEIQNDNTNLYIVTDKQVYVFSSKATPVVSVGDVVRRGDVLADTIVIYKDISDFYQLGGLTVSKAFGKVLSSPIAFYNEYNATEVTTVGDKTKVSVALHGSSSVIKEFWDNVHARGLETSTLAELLDLRSEPETQPTLADLPKQLNPFDLLINELRGNFAIVKIKADAILSDVSLIPISVLARKCLPPRCLVLIMVEYVFDFDYYVLDDVPGDTQPGTTEEIDVSIGSALTDDSVGLLDNPEDPYYTDSGPFAWVVKPAL